jgi:hypothetical protein
MPRPKVDKPASKFEPTKEQRTLVEKAIGYGLPIDQVRRLILTPKGRPVHMKILQREFAEEIRNGEAKANYEVMGRLYAHTEKNPASAIFWAKAKLGWKDDGTGGPGASSKSSEQEELSRLQIARQVAFLLYSASYGANAPRMNVSSDANSVPVLTVDHTRNNEVGRDDPE